ncbi:SUMO ligase siz1 [Rhizoclosmatium sp. JEL0117]|nr:SUMO ligase siz1 [Rhizoclosmatium sp. JEL0117]
MASDASTLVLDLNRLTVAKLKDVCRALGERVSGNRPELVSRLTFAFEQRAARPDRMREARAVVDAALGAKASARPGSAALPLTSLTSSSSTATATATATSAGNHSTSSSTAPLLRALASPLLPLKPLQKLVPQTAPRPNIASLVFRQSPFYSVKEAKPVIRSFPCDTGRAQVKFTLSQADLNSLLIGSDVLLLFVGPESGLTLKPNPFKISGIPIEYPPLDGAHSNAPNHCAIMVNGHMVPPKDYSGIRGKPYTAKPLELNQFLLKNPSTYNTIDLKFTPIMDATRNLLVVVQFASRVNVSNIVDNLKSDKLIPKDSIIAERRQKTVADDDVCLTEEHVSLKDPVTRCRITVPARGNHCRHPQCFDLEYYLRLNQTHPTWSCPICSKLAPLNEVFVDGYFLELLQAAAFDLDIESAEIAADGSWRLNKEENTGVCSDSDSEAGPPTKKIKTDPTATIKAPAVQASSEAIIDLTLSDDDEPSRTAPQIASSQQFTTPVPATPAPATSHPATPRANYLHVTCQDNTWPNA